MTKAVEAPAEGLKNSQHDRNDLSTPTSTGYQTDDAGVDSYFQLPTRSEDEESRTPSPKTARFANSHLPAEQDDSDADRPSVSFHTPSKLSTMCTPDAEESTSNSNTAAAMTSSVNGSTSAADNSNGRKQGYKLQKPKSQRRRFKERTNDSFNLFVPSSLRHSFTPDRTASESENENENENGGASNNHMSASSKEGNLLLRRKLKKIRSKSDAGVTSDGQNLPNHFKRKKFQSVDMGNDMANDYELHSDTEIGHSQDDNALTTTRTGGNEKPKRKFYARSNTMGEFFHNINTFHPNTSNSNNAAGTSTAGGGGGNSGENSPGLFKRRISAFNSGDHSGAWKDLKKTVRAGLGIKKKKPVPEKDYEKSTELITELSAGSPAAVIVAAMFQRDEKGLKRIPVLTEQLKVKITDTTPTVHEKNRKYQLDLEYGSGPARLTWTIHKEYKDFWLMHTRLKSISFQGIGFSVGSRQLPKFPTRHSDKKKNHNNPRQSSSHPDLSRRASANSNSGGTRPSSINPVNSLYSMSSHESFSSSRRSLSYFRQDVTPSQSRAEGMNEKRRLQYEQLTRDMHKYFMTILQMFRFRPDANKLFQFLEISNMSIRLAPENSFHGKEGYLFVRSSSSLQGWRVSHWRPNDLTQMIQRHTNKWFMVRHSYIVCVENIYETNILEVFLVDRGFKVTERSGGEEEEEDDKGAGPNMHITLQIENLERKIKLVTGSDRNLKLWLDSIREMQEKTIWSKQQRFDSFAPVRKNVHAQWFVDGRDYFWAVSGAIEMAKDVIYIHDWWLSPELYMRRPAEGHQEWRLDRLLKRKAEQGVKIFVIVYRNVGQTIPIDSMYTKHSLMDLHPNIYVMRSPNQLLQNTFFWAHHEKLCLIDHTVAFVGGIDLCFGRWDTPDHALPDDSQHAFISQGASPGDPTQIWPGKDYSNPRVQDFYSLDRPYDDMYDREKVPRMPWHDVHMMVFGQPARDLTRHFTQRWNYLIRQKRPSRFTPLLLPPADFTNEELTQLGLDGTCEVQILRSSGNWSLGLQEPEHSIQNAYIKAIEQSEHFVYIENQFFITSTNVEDTIIENKIGDALVERIIRASENDEKWRAIIVIPLMPGFESQVDQPDGSSVRVIMQCQYYSISRGANSIFGRLESAGINPYEYIQFFSLRKWGKVGPNKKIVTEQLYIHAKTMVVDDRVAIIGSANINERSMRGIRDSECAAMIRDAHQLDSYMAGEPYKVAKFAHSLRKRLMREHLGFDIDQIDFIERKATELHKRAMAQKYKVAQQETEHDEEVDEDSHHGMVRPTTTVSNNPTDPIEMRAFNHFSGIDNIGLREKKTLSTDNRVQGNVKHRQDVEGHGVDGWAHAADDSKRKKKVDTQAEASQLPTVNEYTETIIHDLLNEEDESIDDMDKFKDKVYERTTRKGAVMTSTQSETSSENGEGSGVIFDDSASTMAPPASAEHGGPVKIEPFSGLRDPVDDFFYYDTWMRIAEKNTATFREVFRCQPDDEVTTWKEYKEYVRYGEKFSHDQDIAGGKWPQNEQEQAEERNKTTLAHAPLGAMDDDDEEDIEEQVAQEVENGTVRKSSSSNIVNTNGSNSNNRDNNGTSTASHTVSNSTTHSSQSQTSTSQRNTAAAAAGAATTPVSVNHRDHHQPSQASALSQTPSRHQLYQTQQRRPRASTAATSTARYSTRRYRRHNAQPYDAPEAERILSHNVQGHLVVFPTDWLARELETGNWFYNLDRIPPLEIYD